MAEGNDVTERRYENGENRTEKEMSKLDEEEYLNLVKYCSEESKRGIIPITESRELVINESVNTVQYGQIHNTFEYKIQMNKEDERSRRERKINSYEDIRKSLEAQLQTRYQSFEMPKLPWMEKKIYSMEDYYVELGLLRKDRSGYIIEERITIDDIFKSINSKHPYRILIEGNPGYGKTTLAKYLAHRWAIDCPEYFSKFDLVFVLQVRYMKEDLLQEVLRTLKLTGVSKEDIAAAIELYPKKNLFILDGYDEMPNFEIQEMINSVWFQEKWPRSTVVLTSRPSNTAEISKILHKNLIIKGIIPEKQQEFLLKHLRNTPDPLMKVEKVIKLLDKLDNEELLYCPLVLLLLGLLINEQHGLSIPQNRTEIYQDILDFMIRRSLHRYNDTDEYVDLFGRRGEPKPEHCIKLFKSFGKFCLKMLIQNKISFSEESILAACDGDELILNLGILFKNQVIVNNEEVEYVEVVHKTFLEFAASYYLSSLYSKSKGMFRYSLLEYRLKEPNALNPVYIFLIGLLGNNSHEFFQIFRSTGFVISDLHSLVSLLTEMKNPYNSLQKNVQTLDSFTLMFHVSKRGGEFVFKMYNLFSETFLKLYSAALSFAINYKLVKVIYVIFNPEISSGHHESSVTSQELFIERPVLCPIRILTERVVNYTSDILELLNILQPTNIIFECSCLIASKQLPGPGIHHDVRKILNFDYEKTKIEKAKICSKVITKFLVDLADSAEFQISDVTLYSILFTNQLLDAVGILTFKHELSALTLEYGRFNFPEWIVDQQISKYIPRWFQNLVGSSVKHLIWNDRIQNAMKYVCNLEFGSYSFLPFLPLMISSECNLTTLNLLCVYLTQKELNLIYAYIQSTNNLHTLSISELMRYDFIVDLNLLCNHGSKHWKSVSLFGVSVMFPNYNSDIVYTWIETLSLRGSEICS